MGEKREAFKKVLMVVVLDHSRSVGLEQKAQKLTAGSVAFAVKSFTTESYQEVGGRRHGDPVVEHFSHVVAHLTAPFYRLGKQR